MTHSDTPELWEDWWQVVHMGKDWNDGTARKILDAYGTLPDCRAFHEAGKLNRELYNLRRIEPYNADDWAGNTGAVKSGIDCASHRADVQLEFIRGLSDVRKRHRHIEEIQNFRMAFNRAITDKKTSKK